MKFWAKSSLGKIKRGNKKKIEGAKKRIIQYWHALQARNEAIKFFGDYSLMISETKTKASCKGLKTLTYKQMLQRLPIALAQVNAGNYSEKLLNEIRQIAYSLCQSNQITKKYAIT